MMISKNDTISFDECTILHLCEISIPKAFKIFFGKDKIVHRNFSILNQFKNFLDFNGVCKYRFEPLNLETNIIKAANDLLDKEGNQLRMLGNTLKAQILEQLSDFVERKIEEFKLINKDENITGIKQIFMRNEKQLKKNRNIPEDDDLKIIAGYQKFISAGIKYLVTEDEHFWGYEDVIRANFGINIIKEWECNKFNVK